MGGVGSVITRARENARRVACASNLRQWGQGLLMYAQDNRGQLRRSLSSIQTSIKLAVAMSRCSSHTLCASRRRAASEVT